MIVNGQHIKISNPEKKIFPASNISKNELVQYYTNVAEYVLPHLHKRPISMERFPDGVNGERFYQKEIPEYFPAYFNRVNVELEEEGQKFYGCINNTESLVYLANMVTIIHTWTTCSDHLRQPDHIIWDIDPMEDDFEKVKIAARLVKYVLEELELQPFIKTTGSRGLHVLISIKPEYDIDFTFEFSKNVSELISKKLPDFFTTEFTKKKRGKKIYLDFLRNRYAQTAVAPYTVRAIEGAPVAMPIEWSALEEPGFHPQLYNIKNAIEHLKKNDDAWKNLYEYPDKLEVAQEKLNKFLKK